MKTTPLADACPGCFPGDAPAAIPADVHAEAGALSADYSCALCGLAWTTRWEVTVAFPLSREYHPAIPLLGEVIGLLAALLEGEELEAA